MKRWSYIVAYSGTVEADDVYQAETFALEDVSCETHNEVMVDLTELEESRNDAD